MRLEVRLPSLGDDDDAVSGGTISAWMVKEGPIAEGDDLLELTTDKAAFVLPAPRTGTLVDRLVQPGDAIKVGDLIAIMEVADRAE